MLSKQTRLSKLCAFAVLATILALPSAPSARADRQASATGVLAPITKQLTGEGTMSAAARQAMTRGALSAGPADDALKDAANAASRAAAQDARRAGKEAGEGLAPMVPFTASGFLGQSDSQVSPPDTTGATGPSRYVQLTNRRFGIYSRTSSIPISQGTLSDLAAAAVNNFDPQVIWDGNTGRFFYAMDSVFSSTDNRIALGFSRTATPNNGTTDWCHYLLPYGARFPDYPKLGDNQLFMLIGVNNFQPGFVGSDLIAIRKPGSGTISTCPSLGFGIFFNVRDTTGQLVFTPTPSNGIDANGFGYAISRNLFLPSTRLWIHPISAGSATTLPTLLAARVVNVPSYTVPADATQPLFPGGVGSPRLDTLDARPWQAILSRNPSRNFDFSLWTQHTVPNGATSMLRFYEIRPTQNPVLLLRTGTVASAGAFLFNGAISSDRRPGNATTGQNFVIGYSVSSPFINPRIVAGSSVNGAGLSFTLVRDGAGPYRDFTCGSQFNTCRWGDYAGATPDPVPTGGANSAVGLTNQFSPGGAMPTFQSNWQTWIFHVRP